MKVSPKLAVVACFALAYTLATALTLPADGWSRRAKSDNVFGMMFGDGRKLFANQFFTMADVYFHSGYYPSIFDKSSDEPKAIVTASQGRDAHAAHDEHNDHDGDKHTDECEGHDGFMGPPKDWIEAFGRHFKIIEHTHLEHSNEREILPWLRLASELDPQKIEVYTVGSFFLREHLHRADQAEAFLREGLRQNPDSCEILFELGRLYRESLHDNERARNVWELGVKKFMALSGDEQQEMRLPFEGIVVHLGDLEESVGNYEQAINWFRAAQKVSLNPGALQKRIDDLPPKLAAPKK